MKTERQIEKERKEAAKNASDSAPISILIALLRRAGYSEQQIDAAVQPAPAGSGRIWAGVRP